MATPYQNVAKSALINWNGLTEEEATKKIQTESVEELEKQVYATDSIKYAILGIAKQINLSEEETLRFFEVSIKGPENDEIFNIVSQKIQGLTELVKQGRGYYPILPKSLETRLSFYPEMVAPQLIQNWLNKDPAVIQIMQSSTQLNNGTGRK